MNQVAAPSTSPNRTTRRFLCRLHRGGQCEDIDYHIHVSYTTQRVYVFSTKIGRWLIHLWRQREKPKTVRIGDLERARGYAIPISYFPCHASVCIPQKIYSKYHIGYEMSTGRKGQLAMEIVVAMLKRNLIPLPVRVKVVRDKRTQIKGTDLIVRSCYRLQVKCDYPAGEEEYGGTGNLFLQTEECNPCGAH
jgi:hypothetical protein